MSNEIVFGYSKSDVGHIYRDAWSSESSERYWKILRVFHNLSRDKWNKLIAKYHAELNSDNETEEYDRSGRGLVLAQEFTKKGGEYVPTIFPWGDSSPVIFYLKNSGYLDEAIRVK